MTDRREYKKRFYQRQRKDRVERGICARCGKRPLHSTTLCVECLETLQVRSKKKKSEGFCASCTANRPAPGKTTCERCTVKRRMKRLKRVADGLCSKCGKRKLASKSRCAVCLKQATDYWKELKDEAYAAYGGYRCACCGETEPSFLSIDHINNDGAKQRRENKTHKSAIYKWLKANGYPSGFQVLCMSCQYGKRMYGVCPHQLARGRGWRNLACEVNMEKETFL